MAVVDTRTCVCGDPRALGFVHRVDGPCYWHETPPAPGVVVDATALAEIQEFVRELRPMLDQVRELEARWVEAQPFLLELRPLLAQLAAVGKGGAPALISFLLRGKPVAAELPWPYNPESAAYRNDPRR